MLDSAGIFSALNSAAGGPERKRAISTSPEFKSFKGTYALKQIAVDLNEGEWRYYEGGPKDVPLLLCLPGASGTAETLFRQVAGLCPKGYRVIAAQYPPYFTINEFVVGLDAFLDAAQADEVHVFGASLGGFLAQQYCLHRPKRVSSLILCNSFFSTSTFSKTGGGMMTPVYQFMPYFMLRTMLLSSFDTAPASQELADAVEFMTEQAETLGQADMAGRMTLNCTALDCAGLKMEDGRVTLVDSLDKVARPAVLRDELYTRYPNARTAHCRQGGDFPYLSVAEEVNLYIQVHLRRMGLQVDRPAQPDAPPDAIG
eukprot:CAMPEP_0172176834 /NCGR_PEP_ID=MMETSP1050-20130122/15065_1 /TAXON_ID=233186 /ORGANISM="Cryptomonas curvata, Strain CCAP979/52" /LENGTH=313 /DNA_ID=CAMNT_0012849215 /DNA_START=95 /DNA_END=1033 /DNA_ORIENTATION=-